MGFLDTPQPQRPAKLSVERVTYNGKTAWRYECMQKCTRVADGKCKGYIILVQDEKPQNKDDIKACFYNMPVVIDKRMEW